MLKLKNKTLVLCATLFLTLCIIFPFSITKASASPSDFNYYSLFPLTTISVNFGNGVIQVNPYNVVSLNTETSIDITGDQIDSTDYRLSFQGRRLGSTTLSSQTVTNFTTFYDVYLPGWYAYSVDIVFSDLIFTNDTSLYPYSFGFQDYGEIDYAFNVYDSTSGEFVFYEGSYASNNGQFLLRNFIQLPVSYGEYYYIKNFQLTFYPQGNSEFHFSLTLPYTDNFSDFSAISDYFLSLQDTSIVTNRIDILGSVFESVNNFLDIAILPNITFRTLLLIGISIPLLIAILKLFLGG